MLNKFHDNIKHTPYGTARPSCPRPFRTFLVLGRGFASTNYSRNLYIAINTILAFLMVMGIVAIVGALLP